MTILAESHLQTETITALVMAAAVALIVLKPLAALGRWSILRWITEDMAARLKRLPAAWWITTPLLATLMCSVMLPQTNLNQSSNLIAMALFTGLLTGLLINLTRIDAACRLLPDPLTGLLVATGLTAHGLNLPPVGISLADGLIGCILGYSLLWLIALLFKKFRNIDAMGRGDFAMSAGLGAWLGWQSIPMAWMVASLAGILFALLGRKPQQVNNAETAVGTVSPRPLWDAEIPFGPALALGTIATWVHLG